MICYEAATCMEQSGLKPAVGTAVFPFSDGLKPLQGYLKPTFVNTPPHRNTPMETYFYNKNINLIEV